MCVDVEKPLVDAGLEVDFYDKAVPEPPMSTIQEIVGIVEKGGYDLIVGFGGGSPIDVAKAAAVLPHTGDTVYDYVGIDQVKKKGLPIIAVPTTAGTGTEVTAIAIFANEKLNVKQGVVSPHLIPNIALVDPVLTYSCPPGVTAASGMDALIHNIEAYISVNATMHTDPLAAEGIKLISKSIRTAVFDGANAWARHNMAMGSLLGGIAFGNAGVGAVHAMSYPIGGMFHVPHGIANTMVLPWAMELNMFACLRWFRQFGEAMGENMDGLSDREAAQKTVGAMRLLADDLGVPQYLNEVGIPESAIPDLVKGALTQARLWNNNPRKFTAEDMEQVYNTLAVRPGQQSPSRTRRSRPPRRVGPATDASSRRRGRRPMVAPAHRPRARVGRPSGDARGRAGQMVSRRRSSPGCRGARPGSAPRLASKRRHRLVHGRERVHAHAAHHLVRELGDEVDVRPRQQPRDGGRLVAAEHELLLDAVDEHLRRAHAGHPLLEDLLPEALAAAGDEHDHAALAHRAADVVERLLRLVEVDVLGPASGRGDHHVGGLRDAQVATRVVRGGALPVRLEVVAGHGVDDALLLVEHDVEDEVDADEAAGLVDVLAHRVAVEDAGPRRGREHHAVVVADGGVGAEAGHDRLGAAAEAGEVVVLDVAGADAQVGLEVRL